ncbi:MAG: ead/Ea22-like family protein [Serratia marcescens]|nr:ead/Ea22-like family protein [Serratia marcescens]
MTTDITELAAAMKAAAMKATPGQWVAFTHTDSRTFSVHTPDDKRCGDVIKWAGFDGQRKAKANAEFIAMANPTNVLALVEALEKAQTKADVYDMLRDGYGLREKGVGLADLVDWQAKRIAELESRTVKLPDLRQIVSGDRYVWSDGVYNYSQDVKVALAAAGIKVEIE